MRISVIRCVPCVVPDSIQPSIGRYRKCAEPMPFTGIEWIVIDLERRAEGHSTVCAPHKHHVGCASSRRRHACQHINVIVSRAARVIDRQEHLPTKSYSIDPTLNDGTTHVDRGHPIESGCLTPVLRVARTDTVKRRAPAPAPDKNIAVRIHIEGSIPGPVGNRDRRLPGDPAVSGTLELHATAATVNAIVCLVLKTVPRTVGLIDREPLLVTSACALIG